MSDFEARRKIMVDTQIRPSDVTKFPIIKAMLDVPREVFLPDAAREAAYVDGLVPLGDGRAQLDPRSFAKMLDHLNVSGSDSVLDIGVGYGYSSAVLARIAQLVVAVEQDASMAAEAQAQLSGVGADNAIVHEGSLADGAAEHGPYDAIMIQGAVGFVPDAVLAQLKDGGRIVCIVSEGGVGVVRVGYKSGGRVSWRDAFNAEAPVLPGFVKEREFSL